MRAWKGEKDINETIHFTFSISASFQGGVLTNGGPKSTNKGEATMKLFSAHRLFITILVLAFGSLSFVTNALSECIYAKVSPEERRAKNAIERLNKEGHKLQGSVLNNLLSEGKVIENLIQTFHTCNGSLQLEAAALDQRAKSHNKEVELTDQWGRDLQVRFDACENKPKDCDASALDSEIAQYHARVEEINQRKAKFEKEHEDLANLTGSENEEYNKRYIDFATKVESAFTEYEKGKKRDISIF